MSMEETNQTMQFIANTIDRFLNGDERGKIKTERAIGFALLVFPFNAPEGKRVNWVSNAVREDMVVALKEIVARFDGQAEVKGNA
jgi:hypothetical protein